MTEYEGRDPYPQQREEAVDILRYKFQGMWAALWDVRLPFLHPSMGNKICHRLSEPFSLYRCIIDCAPIGDHILRSKHK